MGIKTEDFAKYIPPKEMTAGMQIRTGCLMMIWKLITLSMMQPGLRLKETHRLFLSNLISYCAGSKPGSREQHPGRTAGRRNSEHKSIKYSPYFSRRKC